MEKEGVEFVARSPQVCRDLTRRRKPAPKLSSGERSGREIYRETGTLEGGDTTGTLRREKLTIPRSDPQP